MLRAVSKLTLGLALTVVLAAACGSDDGKKQARKDEEAAGQGGQEDIGAGGGKNHAGEPGALPGGAGGDLPVVMVGGAGGELPVVVSGGAGGEGGEAPDIACCQAKTCEELDLCGPYPKDDGCGHDRYCDCGPATECVAYHCVACEPDPNFCDNHCGATVDNCNNPLKTPCPDKCAEQTPGSICYQETCCTPQTECFNQCGTIDDGCGGTLDCGNNCEGTDVVCGNNHQCCVHNPDTCSTAACGEVWDTGCGEYVDCGSCETGQFCSVDHTCHPSECQAQGFECGTTPNLPADVTENCGFCPVDQGCIDHKCTAICDLLR